MRPYKVLIVDDSAFMRKTISVVVESDDRFEIVGVARNGLEAIEKAKECNPDVITMDVDMPIMNGLESVRHIMAERPTPILMLSAQTREGNETAVEALHNGAVDICYKDGLFEDEQQQQIFLQKLRLAVTTMVMKKEAPEPLKKEAKRPLQSPSLLIIGSSTGGPSALSEFIDRLPADFPIPIVIVQHMALGFTRSLAEKFDSVCALKVVEAERGTTIEKGHVYIAPAGYQTTIHKEGLSAYLHVTKDYSEDTLYKPSVDVTVLSACAHYKKDLLVAILTGMGEDGLEGCRAVKANNGYVIAESEKTAVVYGMPKMVIEAGLADDIVPRHQLYECIRRLT